MEARSEPDLVINPATDEAFARRAQERLNHGAAPAELQAKLRALYPNAIVRSRGLAGESETWYVYRDGHWVPPGTTDSEST
ncbi:MAG TPA: hypothetical protein VFR62_04725 [Gemmatimonadales bacterium]|nr:hypothetical protein [Gemmatimonadales bacterium]